MAVDIKLKRSHTHSNIPTTSDLSEGEFAVNTYDGKMFMRDGSSNIVTVGSHYTTDFEPSTKTFYVTVGTKTSSHVHHGSGSSNGYKINGVFAPFLKLIPGITYRFDQSDGTNSGHPFRFYLDENKSTSYTTGVTTYGNAGQSGAYTEIVVSHSTPSILHYQCSAHGLMGWAAFVNTNNLTAFDTGDLTEGSNLYFTNARATSAITGSNLNMGSNNITTTGKILFANVYSAEGDLPSASTYHGMFAHVHATGKGYFAHGGAWRKLLDESSSDTDDLSEGSSNLYFTNARADARIAAATTDDLSEGSSNLYHTTARVQAISINNVVEDTTPQLGGNLDLNSNDITGTGNISTTGNLTLTSTDAGSSAAPTIDLVRDSSSPADADYLGQIAFKGDDDGGSSHTYAKISGKIGDASAGTEDGLIEFAVVSNGSNEIVARMKQDGLFLNTGNTLRFEGSSSNANETTLTVVNPTADRTISLPDASGTIALTSDIGSTDVSGDSTPQLGGDLDVNGNSIVSASNGNIAITPNGSGKVIIDGLSHPQADGNAGQVLKTDGSGNLSFASVGSLAGSGIQNVSDDSSPQLGGNLDVVTHSIISTSNRDINITPNGSGKVVLDGLSYPTADGTANQVLTTDGSGTLTFADASGGGGSGESVSWSVTQSSHGLAVGDVIYNNGTNYVKAQANATGTLGIFVVSAVADANTFTATFSGKITLSSLTAGQYYFVSTSSAGDFTATEPTSGYSNPILFALSTTEAVVLPYRPQDLTAGGAAGARTALDVFSKAETNQQVSAFAIALG